MAEMYNELVKLKSNKFLTNNGKESSDLDFMEMDGNKCLEWTNGKCNLYLSNQDEVFIMQRGGCDLLRLNVSTLYELDLVKNFLKI